VRAEYDSAASVRRARLLGWGLGAVILLGVVLALAWRIAQISEARAREAMRENLAASLRALAAEQMAQRRPLALDWLRRNPFQLLRWQPDGYCGELLESEKPRRGCWHFLASRAWVLYRPRYAEGRTERGDGLRAYRLRAVPRGSADSTLALELEEVPAAELSGGW